MWPQLLTATKLHPHHHTTLRAMPVTSIYPARDSAEGNRTLRYVPDSRICQTAFRLVQSSVPLPILNHSLRVFLFAKWLAEVEGSEWASDANLDLMFVACICHDLGASENYNGLQRFEVEGADAASAHLHAHGVSPSDAHQVWTAIALHTSAGIAECISSLARLVRLGVLVDFRPATRAKLHADRYGAEIEEQIPRLDIEKVLGKAVVDQALHHDHATKAPPASWPGILLSSHLEDPGWSGVNRAF